MDFAQPQLAALNATPASSLRLLSHPHPTSRPSHAYPRHYNPRYIPYPFEPIRVPPTPLLRTIDLPELNEVDEDDEWPTPPILASPLPTVPVVNLASILHSNAAPSPPSQTNDLAAGGRVLRSCLRNAPRSHRPLPMPPVRRSIAASDAAAISIYEASIATPRPHPPQVHATERVARVGTSASHGGPSAPPAVDALLALPAHPSSAPTIKWDVLLNPFRSLSKPENVAACGHQLVNLHRWAAIRASKGHEAPQPLTSLVLIIQDVPGLEITVERSVLPPLLPPCPWPPTHPRAVILYDVFNQLYRELREPLTRRELAALDEDERARLRQAAGERARHEFESLSDFLAPGESEPLRRVDRLGRRRRFLGIRPARRREVPDGREAGEVFVVELGMC